MENLREPGPATPPERGVGRLLGLAESLLDKLAAAMVWICLIAIAVQVVMRYVFNNANTWSDTLAATALVWLTFLAGTAAVRREENMAVFFLVDRFGPRARKVSDTVCHVVNLAFAVMLVLAGTQLMAITDTAEVEGLFVHVTWAQLYSISVLSGVLIGVFSIERLVRLWTRPAP